MFLHTALKISVSPPYLFLVANFKFVRSEACSVAPVTTPDNDVTVYRHTLEYTSTSLL